MGLTDLKRQRARKYFFAFLESLCSLICGFQFPDSGFWFPVLDSGFRFRIPVPDSGSRFQFQIPVPDSSSGFQVLGFPPIQTL